MELRQRTLVVGKESVAVSEAADLLAVHLGTGAADGKAAVRAGGRSVPALPLARVRESLPGSELAELARFRDAGWVFVERSALPEAPEGLTARVLVGPDGRVSLAPPRVTVKFKDAAVTDPAEYFPVKVVRATPLKFAKGLFSVAFDPAGGMDALEVAGALRSGGKVEYAEPELLAYTGHR